MNTVLFCDQYAADSAHVLPYDGGFVLELMRDVLKDLTPTTYLTGQPAMDVVSRCFAHVEHEMSHICRRYSKFMLLMLVRTLISPAMLTAGSETPHLCLGPLGVMTAAALKLGNDAYEPPLQADPIRSFSADQVKAYDVRRLWALAAYSSYLSGLRRLVGDGVRLRVDANNIFHDSEGRPNELDLLQQRRVANNLASCMSSSACFEVFRFPQGQSDFDPAHPLTMMAIPVTDYTDLHEPAAIPHPSLLPIGPDHPHYQPRVWDYHRVYQLMEMNPHPIVKQYHMTPTELAMVLIAVVSRAVHDMLHTPGCEETIKRTGLLIFTRRYFVRTLYRRLGLASEIMGVPQYSKTLIRRCMHHLAMGMEQFQAIDIHDCNTPSIFYKFGNKVVVDCMYSLVFLRGLTDLVSQDPTVKNAKGKQFEKRMAQFLSEGIPSCQPLFAPNKVLRRNGSQFAEVDLSYRLGRLGLIIDCKAYQVSQALRRGDIKAVNNRWAYNEAWIDETVRKTTKIAENPRGDNYEIPEGIEALVPLVCSTSVEEMYQDDDKHFLASRVPRICTPFELEDLLENGLGDGYQNEFVYRVDRTRSA